MRPPPCACIALVALGVLAGCGRSSSAGSDPAPVSTSPGAGGAVPWVNVFVGTTASNSADPVPGGAGGSTFPGAALPFGRVQWSPDTPNASPPGYEYSDDQITGFSLTHLNGAGCAGMRDFPVFPVAGTADPSADPVASFSHADETASPGFYEVKLGSGIKVDLTATQRTGFGRFTFPHAPEGKILVTAARRTEGIFVRSPALSIRPGDGLVTGQRTDAFFCGTAPTYTVYVAMRFDRPFKEFGTVVGGIASPGATDASGADSSVYLGFDTSQDGAVQLKVGLSYVSIDNAVANLDAESPGWDFDAVHQAAIQTWNGALGRLAVEGGTDDDTTAVYTALYHTLLSPAVASDVNGQFVGLDGTVKTAQGYVRYQDYSGWDIYRSWVQLIAVLAPDQASDILRSLIEQGAECGGLPRWTLASTETGVMVGDPSDAIVASGYAFGARGFDAGAALAQMVKGATDPTSACNGSASRPGLADYLADHFCPVDGVDPPHGTASTTVEYAIDDFAIAQLAGALGDASTKTTFMARAAYWKNVFDPSRTNGGFTGYLQPRHASDVGGAPAFQEVGVQTIDPTDMQAAFVEGNGTQYTLAIQHDVPGLIALLGGDAALVARLDAFFTQVNAGLDLPYFYMGNEPGFVTPWEYPFAGAPWKTQAIVRRILQQAYSTQPGGLPGNDDLGAISSWQVWAMLGLYPAIPGVGGFVIGSPTFPKATLTLPGGVRLVILGDGAAPGSPYVQGLKVNGQTSTSTWLPWATVAGGGTLEFTLGSAPDETWGTGPGDRPPVLN